MDPGGVWGQVPGVAASTTGKRRIQNLRPRWLVWFCAAPQPPFAEGGSHQKETTGGQHSTVKDRQDHAALLLAGRLASCRTEAALAPPPLTPFPRRGSPVRMSAPLPGPVLLLLMFLLVHSSLWSSPFSSSSSSSWSSSSSPSSHQGLFGHLQTHAVLITTAFR